MQINFKFKTQKVDLFGNSVSGHDTHVWFSKTNKYYGSLNHGLYFYKLDSSAPVTTYSDASQP